MQCVTCKSHCASVHVCTRSHVKMGDHDHELEQLDDDIAFRDEMERSHVDEELEGADRSKCTRLCTWSVKEVADFVGKIFGPSVAKCFECMYVTNNVSLENACIMQLAYDFFAKQMQCICT